MPSIHLTSFSGINIEISARNKRADLAQIAHNCLLWDGSLRPMAKWVEMAVPVSEGDQSIYYYKSTDVNTLQYQEFIKTSPYKDVFLIDTFINPQEIIVGLGEDWDAGGQSNIMFSWKLANGDFKHVDLLPPKIESANVTYTPQSLSEKPMNRIYAVSLLEVNRTVESQLTVLPNQDVKSVIYEGDIANISITFGSQPFSLGYGFTNRPPLVRLYRTISSLDTGVESNNEIATEWHLVGELNLNSPSYADGGGINTRSHETFTDKTFLPPPSYKFDHLGITESGWITAVSTDGKITISEKNLYHAWPTSNYYKLPDVRVTDIAISYDNLFIGTKSYPYLVELAQNEMPLEVNITPFSADYPCLENTMDYTSNGAIYATNAGIVGLTRQGMKVLTAGVGNGMLPMYVRENRLDPANAEDFEQQGLATTYCKNLRFRDTIYGAYYNGKYFGICGLNMPIKILDPGDVFSPAPPTPDQTIQYGDVYVGYLYDTGNTLDGEHPNQKLVTFDAPLDKPIDHLKSGGGLILLCKENVYTMPFPDTSSGDDYFYAEKMCYTWKSKKFVFPGLVTFSAAKVVHDCNGFVRLKIYADCVCKYEVVISTCKPFRLPPHVVGVEWEIELQGTATVHEVHLATSMKELLEQ